MRPPVSSPSSLFLKMLSKLEQSVLNIFERCFFTFHRELPSLPGVPFSDYGVLKVLRHTDSPIQMQDCQRIFGSCWLCVCFVCILGFAYVLVWIGFLLSASVKATWAFIPPIRMHRIFHAAAVWAKPPTIRRGILIHQLSHLGAVG